MHFISQISTDCNNTPCITCLKGKAPSQSIHSITSKPGRDCSPMALVLTSLSPAPLPSFSPISSPTNLSFHGLAMNGISRTSWPAGPTHRMVPPPDKPNAALGSGSDGQQLTTEAAHSPLTLS